MSNAFLWNEVESILRARIHHASWGNVHRFDLFDRLCAAKKAMERWSAAKPDERRESDRPTVQLAGITFQWVHSHDASATDTDQAAKFNERCDEHAKKLGTSPLLASRPSFHHSH